MNTLKKILFAFAALVLFTMNGCDNVLQESTYSEFAPKDLLTDPNGIKSILAGAYTRAACMNKYSSQHKIKREEMTTDILTQTGGGEHAGAVRLINFTWDTQSNVGSSIHYKCFWDGIRNANIVLDNVEQVNGFSDSDRENYRTEARFVRIYAYYRLWNQFGTLPLRTSVEDPLELPRAAKDKFRSFIESELTAIIPKLYQPGEEPDYGRAQSGAARALLTKWYLNTKQWQKSADMAKEIIDNGNFGLYPDYNDMFALKNEKNKEFIWVQPALANSNARNTLEAPTFPPGFQKSVDFDYPITFQGWGNFASQYRLRDNFVNSFAQDDERDDRILKKYINTSGDMVNLMKEQTDDARGFKYPPDPNATGFAHGNDIPFIRYADILLSRAEALNELNGPNQNSINLINQIRNRAGLSNINLSGFSSKEELRDHILKERKWEFWYEGKRRRDLIRQGKFIEYAHKRGVDNADEHRKLFPIPQSAINSNPKLEQNPGY